MLLSHNSRYISLLIHNEREVLINNRQTVLIIKKINRSTTTYMVVAQFIIRSSISYNCLFIIAACITHMMFHRRINGIFYAFSLCFQVMQKSCRCGFMYGELTDKETIARIEECLEGQIHDQFEILLYKKTSKFITLTNFCMLYRSFSVAFVAFVARIDGF